MLILSNSLCKSASTITWWYKTELINRTTPVNGNSGLIEFVNSGAVPGQGIFINDPLTDQSLDRLIEYARQNGPTVVKTHCHMTPYLEQMIREEKIVATYAHRDPRDVILSAIDHRAREIKSGGHVWFSEFSSIEASIPSIRSLCIRAEPWITHPQVHKFLYRDTVADPRRQIHAIANTLKVKISDKHVDQILSVEAERKSGKANWMQFNQAKITRYQTEMTPAQIELCNREIGPWVEKFGYQIEESCNIPATQLDTSAA